MTRRRLTPDEIALWRKVTEKVAETAHRPYADQTVKGAHKPKPHPRKPVKPRIEPFEVGAKATNRPSVHMLAPVLSESLAKKPVVMDKKAFQRLKRGKLLPEGKIDLHGMTLDRAHPALTRFILRAHSEKKRLVLVITGKGRTASDNGPIPVRKGILKHQVPAWLSAPPLSAVVMQVSEAHQRHGGSGAYYVYLRRH